jgi:Reverse transcriptase (RNA-dependent DNA polymerase)
MLLAIAAILDWEIHVIDVNSAFLNSKMPKDQMVYLSQPPGYIAEGKEDFVWKLGKALYGLKQSGHLWYQKLKGILELTFMLANLTLAYSFSPHPLQPPSSLLMLMILDSTAVQKVK